MVEFEVKNTKQRLIAFPLGPDFFFLKKVINEPKYEPNEPIKTTQGYNILLKDIQSI